MTVTKLKEYFRLAGKGITNFQSVLDGVITDVRLSHGMLPNDQQEEIIRRRMICANCPFNSEHAKLSIEFSTLNNGVHYKTERQDLHCSICACNIDFKTASLDEKCGLSYYNDLNSKNKQPLKWEEYTKK